MSNQELPCYITSLFLLVLNPIVLCDVLMSFLLFIYMYYLIVSDFLLMEGISAIFKVAIAIVATFRDEIIACKSFETVTEQLKTVIPQKGELELQAVFDQVREMLLTPLPACQGQSSVSAPY